MLGEEIIVIFATVSFDKMSHRVQVMEAIN
jgi:hypothetical protein